MDHELTQQRDNADALHRRDWRAWLPREGRTEWWLAAAFVLYGLVATTFLAINMPPFQNADEPNHFLRAAQLADGGLVATRFPTAAADGAARIAAGGLADPAMWTASVPFRELFFHPERRAKSTYWTPDVYWSATRVMQEFPNTAVYPPLFYAPSAIGVLAGRAAGATVLQTLTLSRLLTGVAAVALGALAIACASGAAVWIFAILTLPMSLALIASSSQDALLLSCSALAGAMLVRALRWPIERNGTALWGLVVALSLVAMARPPYAALAILPLALKKVRWRWRILTAGTIAVCAAAWWAIAAATALTNSGAFVGANPPEQLALLYHNPLLVAHVAWATLELYWRAYLEGFVGWLGWLDTALPPAYHAAAQAMLGVAAIAAMLGLRGERISADSRSMMALGLLVSAGGLFASLYLTWTAPGHAVVEGVQGRYFLPLALVGTGLLPMLGDGRRTRLHKALAAAVLLFPIVSLAVVMRAVTLRYYLG